MGPSAASPALSFFAFTGGLILPVPAWTHLPGGQIIGEALGPRHSPGRLGCCCPGRHIVDKIRPQQRLSQNPSAESASASSKFIACGSAPAHPCSMSEGVPVASWPFSQACLLNCRHATMAGRVADTHAAAIRRRSSPSPLPSMTSTLPRPTYRWSRALTPAACACSQADSSTRRRAARH